MGHAAGMPPPARLSRVQAAFRERVLAKLADGRYQLEEVSRCPCGSARAEPVATSDRFGLPVGVVLCTACALLRTTPRLKATDLPAFYRDDYHGLHMGIERPGPTTSLYRTGQGAAIYELVSAGLSAGPIRAAEIGAGTGSVLREFAAAAARDGRDVSLVGCEYADDFAEVGRSLGTDVRTGGLDAIADIEAPDVLILSHVVEHLPDPTIELRAIRNMVDERTVLYVEVPGVLSIHQRPEYDLSFAQYLTLAHTYHFTLATLREAMGRAGFRFVDGDERVRSRFAVADDEKELPGRDGRVAALQGYLAWLESAPGLRIRRLAIRGRRRLRRGARGLWWRTGAAEGIAFVRSTLRRHLANRK